MFNWKSFGLAAGLTWAIFVIMIAFVPMLMEGWGTALISGLGSLYLGYEATFVGALIGALWAFVDGFIGGAVFAVLYNKFENF